MADTYKTMPVRVKEAKRLIKVVEQHRHIDAFGRPCSCDLPAQPLAEHWSAHQTSWSSTNCHWQFVYEGKNFSCGCRMCTGHDWHKIGNRQRRRAENVELHAALPDEIDLGRISVIKPIW